jgi:carboxypeptidase-like protein
MDERAVQVPAGRHSRGTAGACTLALFATGAFAQAPARDPILRHSAVAGVVRDTLEHPLAFATILVEGRELSVVSDDSGRFHLAGIPSGLNTFTVMRIGYKAVSFDVMLAPESTLVLGIHLKSIQTLGPVTVTGAAQIPRLARTGFYDRQRLGLGTFLSPQRIDSLDFVDSPAQLLRGVRGIDVRCFSAKRCSVHTRSPPDCLWLFVDGAYVPAGVGGQSQIDDVMGTGEVGAIEVYERPMTVPSEFQAQLPAKRAGQVFTVKAGCGALVIWTRTHAR